MRIVLREWRLKRDFTQRELADKAGVGIATVIRIESGADTTVETIEKLGTALRMNPGRLLRWGEAGAEAAPTLKRPYHRRGPRMPKS